MRYVTVEEVVGINEDVLGDDPVIRDAGLLASAVGRPAQVVFGEDAYRTLYRQRGRQQLERNSRRRQLERVAEAVENLEQDELFTAWPVVSSAAGGQAVA